MTTPALEYYKATRDQSLIGLTEFLKIASISKAPEHKSDVRRAAEFIASELVGMGIDGVDIIEGEKRHPLVYGEWMRVTGKPTLLIYGHYDVQPPDPLDEWKSPPFRPEIRDQNIYARGAADDKGQTYLLMKAVGATSRARAGCPST